MLFGRINPGGRLPITFPASLSQLPRPKLDGSEGVEIGFAVEAPRSGRKLAIDYDIEGSDVGYRWFARKGFVPLFPFGYGLSFTQFAATAFNTDGVSATTTIANTGARAGDYVAQVYLVSRAGKGSRRLVGFQRVSIAPGKAQNVQMRIDPRLLADWTNGQWCMPKGDYVFAQGENAGQLGQASTVRMSGKCWR